MRLRLFFTAPLLATLLAGAPAAADLVRITDRAAFVSTVQGREISRLGISLNVAPDGAVTGRAFGRDVTGLWYWQGGMFCRTMNAGDFAVPYNCQVVSANDGRIRFHSDGGTGDFADFRIR